MAQAAEKAQGAVDAHGAAIAGHGAAHGAAHGGGGLNIDPMHQFNITSAWEYLGVAPKCTGTSSECLGAFTFTNSALFMVIALTLITVFMLYSARSRALVPDRLQSISELGYEFIANMVRDISGKEGKQYFPFVFSVFVFILVLNMLGMVPYSYTATSQIVVTFGMAIMVFLTVTIIGFARNGVGFLKMFVPEAPLWLLPLIIPIEAISYLIRPISLSVRLFANMMAGHMMLKVFAYFVIGLGVLAGWAPLLFMVVFTGMEVLIAFLQAFVFAVLTCIYLNDALHVHH